MKVKQTSILHVRWSHGRSSWYKVSKGRNIASLIHHFRGYSHFKWARLHYYRNKIVGPKYYWFTRETEGF